MRSPTALFLMFCILFGGVFLFGVTASEMDQLRQENHSLKAEITALRTDLAACRQDVESARSQRAALDQELAVCTAQLEQVAPVVAALIAQLETQLAPSLVCADPPTGLPTPDLRMILLTLILGSTIPGLSRRVLWIARLLASL